MYCPVAVPLLGEKLSPVPVPVPDTNVSVKLVVWSVPVEESTTVHVVPSAGLVISSDGEPFPKAWK